MADAKIRVGAGTCAHALLTVLAAADDRTFAGTVSDLAATAWPGSPSSGFAVVRRLERAELVAIERANSRKALSITITEAGLAEIGAEPAQADVEDDDDAEMGRIERKTRDDIDAMVSTHPMGEALAEGAIGAARRLDSGVEDKSYAGVMREWRSVLVELAKYATVGADELEQELSEPTDGESG